MSEVKEVRRVSFEVILNVEVDATFEPDDPGYTMEMWKMAEGMQKALVETLGEDSMGRHPLVEEQPESGTIKTSIGVHYHHDEHQFVAAN